MNKRDKISVIIPVYNVEPYLEECILSVCRQTYDNLEIILVDDGSTDNCGTICDNYAGIDSRIRVLHKKNGGLSDARNFGIEIATGEYITFIDSDDYVYKDYISYLYKLICKYQADISICGYLRTTERQNSYQSETDEELYFDNITAMLYLLYQKKFTSSAWAKLYKLSIFKEIRFPVNKLHEDVAIMYKLFHNAMGIAYGSHRLYFYFQRSGSIVNSSFRKDKMNYIEHTSECIKYMNNISQKLYKAAISRHFSACFELIITIKDKELFRDEYIYLRNNINKYKYMILCDKHARLVNRIAALLTVINIDLAIFTCKLFNKKDN